MTKLTRLAALPMLTVGLAWSTGCDVMTEEAEDLAAGDGDSPNAMVSEVSASAKNQELEAWRYSTLKKSTLDSSTPSMKEADKCRIEAKTRVRISNVVMVGRHFRGTLTESIRRANQSRTSPRARRCTSSATTSSPWARRGHQ